MAFHSRVNLEALERKANCFVTSEQYSPNPRIRYLYRNKPNDYFGDIMDYDGIMSKTLKDGGGDPRCPINHRLGGLFFLGKNNNPRSPFGDTRINIPATDMFNGGKNLYFADFFCMTSNNHHYITTVVTTPGSEADKFCQRHLLPLDKYNNPYIWLSDDGRRVYVDQGPHVWVEVFYTEDIDIQKGLGSGRYIVESSDIIGEGHSRPDGIPKRWQCDICNI